MASMVRSRRPAFFFTTPALALGLALFLLGASSAAEREQPPVRKLAVRTHSLNRHVRELDGQWQANTVASDGNCYFFSSTHHASQGAAFFRYDPRTKKVEMLCRDVTHICGEDPKKSVPQGKVHSDMIELDGWLYCGTHLARYSDSQATAYPGAHVIGYELATGKFRDYGIVHPRYSIYSGFGIDPARKCAYVYVRPFGRRDKREGGAHLYRVDLGSGKKQDLGMVHRGSGACYHFFIDAEGTCWFAIKGTLYRVRAGSDEIERFAGDVPEGRSWRWAQALPDGKRCLLTLNSRNSLWLFDPAKPIETGEAHHKIAGIGPTGLGMIYANGRVFYIQPEGRNPFARGGGGRRDLHLCSIAFPVNPRPQITDHGLLVDQDGRRPWKLASISSDGKGSLFMVGAWHVSDEEKDEIGVWKGRGHGYCGQFFSVVELRARHPGTADPHE